MENRLRIKPYFLVFLSAILAISISGCSEDFFDQKAGDRITPDQHYLTSIDAVISSQGAIAPLQDIMPQLIMLDGLRSDMMNVTENAQMHLREINEQIFMSGNPFIDPSSLYKVIININEVLANIDKVALTDRNFDPYITRIYKGNMIAMRSWAYFTLAKLYGKVSYIEDNLTEIDTDLPVLEKRVLIDTLIAQLRPEIDSLLFAETQMIEFALDHYINPKALLGELYLEIDDYANAVTYLKYACESFLNQPSVFKVDQTYKDAAWSTIFLNAETNGVENLSVVPFSSVEDQFNPLANWLGVNYAYEVKPSQVLVDSFLSQIPAAGAPGDLYRGIGVSIGRDTMGMEGPDYIFKTYITKYEVDKIDPFSSDIILSRAADLHLLMAEAYNRMGDVESQEYALMLLNQGVNKVNPKPAEYVKWARNQGIRGRVYLKERLVPDELTGEARILFIEDLIIAERAMELAFEGKRWFDLVRVAERRDDPSYLAEKVASKFDGTMYTSIRDKLLVKENWYLPFE